MQQSGFVLMLHTVQVERRLDLVQRRRYRRDQRIPCASGKQINIAAVAQFGAVSAREQAVVAVRAVDQIRRLGISLCRIQIYLVADAEQRLLYTFIQDRSPFPAPDRSSADRHRP